MANLKQQTKDCKTCGLTFTNRKKWESRGLWPEIMYCSARCRSQSNNRHQSNKTNN